MGSSLIHVLMTGAGAPGAAGIIKCLLQEPSIHLTVADADENATGRHLHANFIALPKAGNENFAEEVLRLCIQKSIHIVLPLVTRELLPLSQYKNIFEENGVKVVVSSKEAIEIANNKSACYHFLEKKGLRVPQYRIVQTVDEFKAAAEALGYPQKSFCFKPSVSNGSRGFRIVAAQMDESDLLFNHKPYQSFINYNDAIRILSSKPFPELLVAEYLPGDEYSVDCLAKDGKAVLVVPRIRHKMINGISVQGEFVKDEKMMAYCSAIIEAIGLHGNIGIQVKAASNGEPFLLEINPRVQGTIVAALGAGVNLPVLAIKQALGLKIEAEEMQVTWGTKFSRYWTEVFY